MKKDKQISLKITGELLQKVQEYADIQKWSVSQTVCVILEKFFAEGGESKR